MTIECQLLRVPFALWALMEFKAGRASNKRRDNFGDINNCT